MALLQRLEAQRFVRESVARGPRQGSRAGVSSCVSVGLLLGGLTPHKRTATGYQVVVLESKGSQNCRESILVALFFFVLQETEKQVEVF